MQETYVINITSLGTRFDPNSAALNVRNILRTKLRRKGLKSGVFSISGTELYVTGIPEQDIVPVINAIQESSAKVHGQPFKYSLEKVELSEEELQEKQISGLENLTTAQESKINSLEAKINDLKQRRDVSNNKQQQYRSQIIDLEGKLKLAETKSGAVIREVQEVKVQYFRLPDNVLEDIMYVCSRYVITFDEICTKVLEGKTIEEAIALSKLNPFEFLAKRLNFDIEDSYDLNLWLTRQQHYECKNEDDCEHTKLISNYQTEYGALRIIVKLSESDEAHCDIPYLIVKEGNNGIVYAPIGTSKGWLTKQIRDHITDTLVSKYGAEKVKSHKEKNTRRIIVENAELSDIKHYLDESQSSMDFYKLGFRIFPVLIEN